MKSVDLCTNRIEEAGKAPDLINNRRHNVVQNSNDEFQTFSGDINENKSHLFTKLISRCQHTDWDLCEMVRMQELNETRQRASQMENTMRWWSQCTANWRQKWDTVRNERNRARDELTRLRSTLYEARQEIERLTASKEQSDTEVKALKLKLQKVNLESTLQPILQDISAVEKIAAALTSRLHAKSNVDENTINAIKTPKQVDKAVKKLSDLVTSKPSMTINNFEVEPKKNDIMMQTLKKDNEEFNKTTVTIVKKLDTPKLDGQLTETPESLSLLSSFSSSSSSDITTKSLKPKFNSAGGGSLNNEKTRAQILMFQYGGSRKKQNVESFNIATSHHSTTTKQTQRSNSFC